MSNARDLGVPSGVSGPVLPAATRSQARPGSLFNNSRNAFTSPAVHPRMNWATFGARRCDLNLQCSPAREAVLPCNRELYVGQLGRGFSRPQQSQPLLGELLQILV